MTEAVVPVKYIDEVTECAICHDVFTDPRSLPCIHTFCLKCITDWFKDKLLQDTVSCPLCRNDFKLPQKGVDDLPKNIFVGKLLAVRELSSTCMEQKLCDRCKPDTSIPDGTTAAKVYCIDCQEHLCDYCKDFHSNKGSTRTHRTIRSGDSLDEVAQCLSSKCDKHLDKDLEIYCFDCADTVCLMCFVTQHHGHKAGGVKEVVGEFKTGINRNISGLNDGKVKLDKSLAALEARRSQIVEQASKVEQEICMEAEQLKQMIDRHKDKLLTEVNQLRVKKIKIIENDIMEMKQNKAMIESLMKYSQELLKKGSNSDITRESKSINKRAEEMAKFSEEAELVFDTSEQIISFSPAGKISDAVNCIGDVLGGSDISPTIQICEPTLRGTFSHDSCVTAVAVNDGKLFVAHYGNSNNVDVYDTSNLQLLRQLSVPKCMGGFGLATCSTNNCLYVSDWHKAKIHKVSLSTYSVTTSWSVATGPRGLSVNRSHNLLVTSRKIQEFSTIGSLVREISDSNYLWQAIELDDGTLAVTRTGPVHEVCVMSVDGKVLRSYGSSSAGSGPGKMHWPLGLAVDKRGFIVVAHQGNNRIVLLNPTMTDSRVLSLPVSPGFINPYGLWYDERRGRLYVGEFGGHKRLLVFDGVFNLNSIFSR